MWKMHELQLPSVPGAVVSMLDLLPPVLAGTRHNLPKDGRAIDHDRPRDVASFG